MPLCATTRDGNLVFWCKISPHPPAIAYVAARIAEAWGGVNQADSRAARAPGECAFVNGSRRMLQAFTACVDLAVSNKPPDCQDGALGC